jgi:DNA repair protein RadD
VAFQLYPHQTKAIEATFDYFKRNAEGMPLIVAPVGSGKSLLIAEFIRRACELYPSTNFVVVSHVTELLTQDADHLREQWPAARMSFYAQKLGKKSFDGQAIFASINSVYKKAYKIPHAVDIVIIDEAHLISPNAQTMYQKFIKDLKVINPALRVIGYTGTNFRATEGRLTEGEGRLFTDVAYQIPMLYLVEKGFLCPLVTPTVKTKMSVDGVKSRNGDYVEGQLQAAVDKDPVTRACVDEILEHGAGRKKWLVFTAGVIHCKHVMEEIRSRGISCEMVTGETPTGERNKIVEAYKKGDLRCLVNVGVFTTGFNNPYIDLMAFMRPTRSPVLYVQMAGRGMRTAPGKMDCLLLDFGAVISELGPVDLVDAHRVAGAGVVPGDAPVKLCPVCNAVCFAGVAECQDCGHQFPDRGKDIAKTASTMKAMSNQIEPIWHEVISITYKIHVKEGKTPSLCVTYNTLDGPFREWVCYEHSGFAREKAARWHKARSSLPCPTKVVEALGVPFKEPAAVQTRAAGKFHEVIGFDWV